MHENNHNKNVYYLSYDDLVKKFSSDNIRRFIGNMCMFPLLSKIAFLLEIDDFIMFPMQIIYLYIPLLNLKLREGEEN